MGNTQGVWILYGTLLTLNILDAKEQKNSCGETLDMETAELNQSIYFKDALTSKWKSENKLLWGRGYDFFSPNRKQKVVVLFKINEDQI